MVAPGSLGKFTVSNRRTYQATISSDCVFNEEFWFGGAISIILVDGEELDASIDNLISPPSSSLSSYRCLSRTCATSCCYEKPAKPTPVQYGILLAVFITYSIVAGYNAGLQPIGKWRYFSWHPFLMTFGMVGLSGISAITKKLGGYTNTKVSFTFWRRQGNWKHYFSLLSC